MRVVLAAVGSRGDVAPFGALAARLQENGHDAHLVTHAALAPCVPRGVPLVPVDSDPHRLLAGPAAEALRRGDLRAVNRTRGEFADFLSSFFEPTADALEDADVLVASTFALAPVDAALTRGVPVIRAHMWPENRGLGGPMPLLPFSWLLPGPLRRGMRGALRRVERYFGGFDGGWTRGRLRLHPHHPVGLSTATHGTLLAVSPAVLPASRIEGCATGWWWPEPATSPSSGLRPVSTSTSTWVSMTFGSMPQDDLERVLTVVSRAAERVGVRALVQLAGAEGFDDGTILGIGEEPHAALFARVDLAVHHGGSGTTGAVARAGIPSVVVPHFADQFYWGHRLRTVGVAPPLLPRGMLTGERLARRIEAGLRPQMRRRAVELGRRVRSEDGTGQAVRVLVDAVEPTDHRTVRGPRSTRGRSG